MRLIWVNTNLIVLLLYPLFLFGEEQKTKEETIYFKEKKVILEKVFENIEKLGITLSYNTREINTKEPINVPQKELLLTNLLDYLEKEYLILSKVEKHKIIFTKKQAVYTISGFILDANSKETLVGGNIIIKNSKHAAFSNAYGFYSITLAAGSYELEVSYIGYTTKNIYINLNRNIERNIILNSSYNELENIVITPQKKKLKFPRAEEIDLQKVNTQPQLFGNNDILKRLQLIPGVGGGISGFSDLLVRGGDANENLVLLDGVPIYNYNHFPGLISVFNTEALKKVNLYKGLFPAQFGGKLSSVIDVKMREGNMEDFHFGGTVDLSIFSFFVEGPILKGKSSFLFSVRRSWIDFLSGLWGKDNKFDFHLEDFNLKANYILNRNNRLYLSMYFGKDKFGSSNENIAKLAWGNKITALRWNHIFSDKVFTNTTLSISNFDNILYTKNENNPNSKLRYKLKEIALGTDIDYFHELYKLKMGTKILQNYFSLAESSAKNQPPSKEKAIRWVNYIENKFAFTKKTEVYIGLHHIFYHHNNRNSHFFQPRLSLNYSINNSNIISLGFSEMQQFIHHLGPSSISVPYAFRMPSSEKTPASSSRLYEINYTSLLRNSKDKLQFSLYYKNQKNILRYRIHQNLFNDQLAKDWQNQVIKGERKGFGVEASYSAKFSPFEVNLAYTFSDFKEKFSEINGGKYHPNSLNTKHLLKTIVNYNFGKRNSHTISIATNYSSGQHITLPIYSIAEEENNSRDITNEIFIINNINNYQLKDNFYIDIAYTFMKNKKAYKMNIFKAGVFSVLGKPAPFDVFYDISEQEIKITKTALPYPMPYLSYTFKF